MSTCTGPECDRPASARGLCATHYAQLRAGRDLAPIRRQSPRLERTVACPDCGARPGEGCWQWHVSVKSRHERSGFHAARARAASSAAS
ncbi:zinc finger domain-containing protein [Brachybacterium sp.]|uniref:zinc finger domain-containing protein n=1 Tax=Brachybacterium sp. TaxID=1891286 RepID=UPI003BB94D0B